MLPACDACTSVDAVVYTGSHAQTPIAFRALRYSCGYSSGHEDTADFPSKFVLDNGRSVIRSAEGYDVGYGGNNCIPETETKLKLCLLAVGVC